VNPVSNRIYVANGGGTVTVIDGATHATATVAVGIQPAALTVDAVNNRVYAANYLSNTVTVIDGVTNATVTLTVGTKPYAIGTNPVTNKIYVAHLSPSGNVTVIDGATNLVATVADPNAIKPQLLAINPVTNKVYVANSGSNLTVLDGASNTTSTVSLVAVPFSVAVNPITNRIYVSHYNAGKVTVLDGTSNSTTATVTVAGTPGALAVNAVTNKIYVTNHDAGTLTIMDGASNTTASVFLGSGPYDVAVNPVTNKIYVADGLAVDVIDGLTNALITSVSPGTTASKLAVNPVTNKIYVANFVGDNVTVIDGATNTFTLVPVAQSPFDVVVNPVTNRIYVSSFASNSVTVIDGTNNQTTPITTVKSQRFLAVNPVTNKIYAADKADASNVNGVTVIDGATNTATRVIDPNASFLQALVVNAVTNKIYVANFVSNNITVLTEQQAQPIPLTTSITSPSGNQLAAGTTSVFNFTTHSAYTPRAPVVQSVYYQFDTWQGPWLQATGSAPNFIASVPPLPLGLHIIYAYAADSQFADAIQPGNGNNGQSGPIPGAIAAYLFVVALPATATSLSLTSGTDPSLFGDSLVFTATVTSSSGIPVGNVVFYDLFQNNTVPAATVPLNAGSASWAVTSLPVGVHTIVATYNGNANFAPSNSPSWTQYVLNNGTFASTTNLSATPSVFFHQRALFSVQVTVPFPETATGQVVLVGDGNQQLSPLLTLDGNGAAAYSTPLRVGRHNIRAIYFGDSDHAGSNTAGAQAVQVSPRPHPR
jgi:YVTN family beta-propeller protein